MAGCNSKFEDTRFQNWIKATYAGNIAKEGLEDFVFTVIAKFHNDILEDISVSEHKIRNRIDCSECSIENVLDCRTNGICDIKFGKCSFHNSEKKKPRLCENQICNKIRDAIKRSHNYGNPSWKNTQTEQWCSSPCEILKCYLPRDGYMAVTSVQMMDFNGLLNVLTNHKAFGDIVDQNLCILIKDSGKQLRHSPDLYVENSDLEDYLGALIKLLKSSDPKSTNKKTKEAIEKIRKLQVEHLSISTNDMIAVLQKLIEEKVHCSLQQVEETSKKCIENMKSALKEIKASLSLPSRGTKRTQELPSETTAAKRVNTSTRGDIQPVHFLSPLAYHMLTDEQYETIRNIFKEDLLLFNSSKNGTIPLSPLFEKLDAQTLDIYVLPDMFSVEVKKSKLGGSEIKYPVESLEGVFRKQSSNCKEIYLTADAGLGKTAFCKYLVMMWCQAHDINHAHSEDNQNTDVGFMRNFDFLFLISLRESRVHCDVDDMIFKLIVSQFSHSSSYPIQILQEILHRENCLVILDGLDEWTHRDDTDCVIQPTCVPHRKARERCTILTTSRPWKLSMMDINRSQIHHQIEMIGLSELGKDILKRKALLRVNANSNECSTDSDVSDPDGDELASDIDELEKVPMLLMYLVCIRSEGKPLPRSKCELFSQIIDLKLSRNKRRIAMLSLLPQSGINNLPGCLASLSSCIQYVDELMAIGKLAFYTLFSETRENTIVFDSSKAREFICQQHLSFGLSSGILTQSEITGYMLCQKSSVCYTHKIFQEFFAALYVSTSAYETEVMTKLQSVCSSIQRILEMSNVFIFLSGMSTRLSERISKKLVTYVSNDDITRKYRRTESFWDYFTVEEPLKRYQGILIACLREHAKNIGKQLNLCLQDFIIDSDCQEENYISALKSLALFNKDEIKSLNIELEGTPCLHDIMMSFQLNDVRGIEHVYLRGECSEVELCHLLSGSVDTLKSVAFLSRRWQSNHFEGEFSMWSHKLCTILQDMERLEAIHLNCFMIDHKHLEELLLFLSKRSNMREIILGNIPCHEHLDECAGFALDLSKLSHLRTLRLHNVSLSHLQINATSLEQVSIGRLPCSQSNVLSTYLGYLSDAPKLERFRCSFLESSRDVDEILRVITKLVHLKDLRLHCIDLGRRSLKLSTGMTDIQCVHLSEVTMSSLAFHDLIKTLMAFEQAVLVVLVNCVIGSDNEYAMIRRSIRSNEKLVVTFSGRNQWENDEFSFRTVEKRMK